jgi:hypothetical protein
MKGKLLIKLLFVGLSSLMLNSTILAQGITIDSKLDTNMILIGDHVKFSFEVTQPKDFELKFPELQDTIIDKIEILERSIIDTTELESSLLLKQELLITSFDTGLYLLPRLPFAFISPADGQPDTIYSPRRYFGVNTFQLDTTDAIFDIKMPVPAPVSLMEAAPWIGGFIILVLVALGIIYYLRIRAGKETIVLKRPKPKEPPHLFAYRQLDALKDKKMWQQGKVKEFHSDLTEILRTYIELRYNIMALEMTTEETISIIESSKIIDKEIVSMLNSILSLADFVKFAKMNPLPDENDKCLKDAYIFIDKTKPVVKVESEDEKLEENEDEQKIVDQQALKS